MATAVEDTDHLAFAHLIPVIDGGIQVRFKKNRFTGVDWQLQTASPERPCLECLGVYSNADVATGIAGISDFGVQRYRYNPGIVEQDVERTCRKSCIQVSLAAQGDEDFILYGQCKAAEKTKQRIKEEG